MTLVKHELRLSFKSLMIWSVSIAFLLMFCLFMFPEMKGQMDDISGIFASMGVFTEAFGMDRLNFGTLIGFYCIECGNIIGIGGSLFASLIAISVLAKEEKDKTAEFLLSHPISRSRVVTEKALAVLIQIIALNLIVWVFSIVSILIIGEVIPWKELILIHVAYFIMQIELAGICGGISAFIGRGGIGIGLGIAIMMYFLNLIGNISKSAEFLKYISPFGYTEAADIITDGCLRTDLIILGMVYTVIFIALAYFKYTKKDIK